MEQVIATVNINIGLGKQNPSLVIRKDDNVPQLVNKLIEDYKLPKKVFAIIMERVTQELPPPPTPKNRVKQNLHKTAKADKSRSVSPIRTNIPQTVKPNAYKQIGNLKENCRNTSNLVNQQQKNNQRKSLSPVHKTINQPMLKKVELKPSRTPLKQTSAQQKQPIKKVKQENVTKIQRLFRHLIKDNPSNIKMLSPQHINIKGMDRGLLSELQQFFQCLQENEFDQMTEAYFINKANELGFKLRLTRKEYEHCYCSD